MTTSAVCYLITGSSHLANIVVSLVSLRRHWDGPVLFYAWPESYGIAERICADPSIDATPILCDAEYKRRNAQEIHKIALIQSIKDFDRIVYLDADTIVMKSIVPLIVEIDSSPSEFVATQFGEWRMHQKTPTARVSRLLGIDGVPEEYVRAALSPELPSYNSGVFACSPTSPVLPDWGDWTNRARGIYISGECALHPIARKYPITTLYGGAYNCSPKYKARSLPVEDVAIWHFHGDCNTRPDKCEYGVQLWWSAFSEVFKKNTAGVQDWIKDIGNAYLPDLLKDRPIWVD